LDLLAGGWIDDCVGAHLLPPCVVVIYGPAGSESAESLLRRRRLVELVVAAEPERPRRSRPALGQVLVVALSAVGRERPHAPEAPDELDHRPVLEEVGAVHVVPVAQEDIEAEPLVDPEVSGESLGAD